MLAKRQAQEREMEEQDGGMRPGMMLHLTTKPQGPPTALSTQPEDSCSTVSPQRDEWSSEVYRRPSGSSNLQEEIDRQFAAMKTGLVIPKTDATISEDEEEEEGVEGVPEAFQIHSSPFEDASSDESEEEVVAMITPIHPTKGLAHHHDGNVQNQELEDTTGVKVPDRHDILVPKSKARTSIFSMGSQSSSTENTLQKVHVASPIKEHSPTLSRSLLSDRVPQSPSELLQFKVILFITKPLPYYIALHT